MTAKERVAFVVPLAGATLLLAALVFLRDLPWADPLLRERAVDAGALALVAFAVAALARRFGVSRAGSSLLALAVVAHPLFTQCVVEPSHRRALAALLGVAVAARLVGGFSTSVLANVAAGAALLGALLADEATGFAALPALLFVLLWSERPRRARRNGVAALALALVVALLTRHDPFGTFVGLEREAVSPLENPLVDEPLATRALTAVALLGRQVVTFAWPRELSADWTFAAVVPLRRADGDFAIGVGALLVAAFVAWRAARRSVDPRSRAVAFALLLALPSWFVLSSVVRPVEFARSEPYLLVPGVALLLALAVAADRALAARWSRALGLLAAAAVVAALALRSARRVDDWADPLTLWTSASRAAPESARVHGQLAGCFRRRGETGKALVEQWLRARVEARAGVDVHSALDQVVVGLRDERVRADFVAYGERLVADASGERSGVALHAELAAEVARWKQH